ncbi:MAG: hypothetical protein ACHREM_18010 [Polyangiales bacterium]
MNRQLVRQSFHADVERIALTLFVEKVGSTQLTDEAQLAYCVELATTIVERIAALEPSEEIMRQRLKTAGFADHF